ncbi:farnesyl diphosphate synthase [Zoogloea sp.]|uniref:polyprenyl synthetase family protein n=1 Tax=Zoogloea sp. TaxID=49181 RepID=UPI00260406E6|nr:farnesyl diphosphate synthase [Zoogloea sp.]MDD3355141.1 polyprenyl synthetase family protein [Zoogloea sp.]
MNARSFNQWMSDIQERTEAALDKTLPAAALAPARLHEAMRYAVLDGGKRVRPLLVHAAGQISGAAPERLDRVACALEMIHAYSLVHDDMPCMDDDVLRRGKPTVHVEFDEATALLVGDALQSLAFQHLADAPVCDDPRQQIRMIRQLAQASGSRGMAGGQAIDLASVGVQLTLAELEFMHIHKTGALIRASIALGVQCGRPLAEEQLSSLDHVGKVIGLLFQVIDDILDAEADTATLGKTAGKDAANDKPTYVSLLGGTRARELAAEMCQDALERLAAFGDDALRLRELTRFIVNRQF